MYSAKSHLSKCTLDRNHLRVLGGLEGEVTRYINITYKVFTIKLYFFSFSPYFKHNFDSIHLKYENQIKKKLARAESIKGTVIRNL